MEQSCKGLAPALERGLEILELVSASDESLGFSDLERKTNIPKATLNRLLKVLCGMQYLAKELDGKYVVGPRCGIIGAPNDMELLLKKYGQDIVRNVCDITDNTCILFFWDGKQTRVVAKAMDEMSLSMQAVGNVSNDYTKTPWGWMFLGCPECSPDVTTLISESELEKKNHHYKEHGFMLDLTTQTMRLTAPIMCGKQTVGALALGAINAGLTELRIVEYGQIIMEHAQNLSNTITNTRN